MMEHDCYSGPTSAGIDVSHHQGTIDWSKVGQSGLDFAIIRTGFGIGEDDRFAFNWREAGKTNLRRGTYQYLRMDRDGREQARVMARAIRNAGGLRARDLPPAADVEGLEPDKPWNANASPEHIAQAVTDFMDEIERQLGRKPILYTGGYWVTPGPQVRAVAPPLPRQWSAPGSRLRPVDHLAAFERGRDPWHPHARGHERLPRGPGCARRLRREEPRIPMGMDCACRTRGRCGMVLVEEPMRVVTLGQLRRNKALGQFHTERERIQRYTFYGILGILTIGVAGFLTWQWMSE
jgi:hypothetical protein